MRLLIVASEFPPGPGGIGRHAHELGRALGDLGWEVEAYVWQAYAPDSEIEAFNADQPMKVTRAPPRPAAARTALEAWIALARGIRRRRPDVILATGRKAVWLTAATVRSRGIPWMAVGHGTEFGVGSSLVRMASRRAYGAADVVVCVSEYTRMSMEGAGIVARSVRVIPNGADPVRFRPLPADEVARTRRAFGLDGRRVLLTVGRVGRRKGQDVVVRGLPAIAEAVPDVIYLLAGLADDRSEIEDLAARIGVAGRVRLLGRVPDDLLVRIENAADVFVMTSRRTPEGDFEGYGIAVVEAALCGKPAVVARNSGLVEAIEDEVTGIAVPPEDPEATAEALRRLLLDEGLRRMMGEHARARALREQTWASRAKAYDGELRRLAGAPPVAPSAQGIEPNP